jgi:uncharacterized membrane protein YcaP (DUF421 family)
MISIGQAVSAALIQFLWQGALVALLLSILLTGLRRRSAQSRYLATCMALLILAVLPIVTSLVSLSVRSVGRWATGQATGH